MPSKWLEPITHPSHEFQIVLESAGGRLVIVRVLEDEASVERFGDWGRNADLGIEKPVFHFVQLGDPFKVLPNPGTRFELILESLCNTAAQVTVGLTA